MSKRKRPHTARRSGHSKRHKAEPDLLDDVRAALAEPDPLHMLSLVSALASALDPRGQQPLADLPIFEIPTLGELAGTFIEVDVPETTALLAVIAELAGDDEVLRARIRRTLDDRAAAEPVWLTRLSETTVYRILRMGHVFGDGDNVMLGVRLAGEYEVTFLVYVDHNMGTVVKDAFVVPEPIDVVVAEYEKSTAGEPGMMWEELSGADARAWIDEAISLGAITFPPFETESWPECRPLVEWVVRRLPDGGTGYQRPQWEQKQRDDLANRFFASVWGRRLDDADHRSLLESLMWYAVDYGPGDPLRWSSVKVEILLTDWLPRKVVAPVRFLSLAPDLLRAFVCFVHDEVDMPQVLTDETLSAINDCRRRFIQGIQAATSPGPPELLAALSGNADIAGVPGLIDHDMLSEMALNNLAQAVGGRRQLDRLGVKPLPDEVFRWGGIPEDIAPRVTEVLALVDSCCNELLDVEYRTACRRLLARVALADPAVFSRRGRAETAAAGLVWIVGQANGLFDGTDSSGLRVKDLAAHFGVGNGSPAQRGVTMLRAMGLTGSAYGVNLGSPDYLVAECREWIVQHRDTFRDRMGM
ncbi:DUF6398 domain-containing protein [Mycolicibacterium phocaicum]|uniref:DUF6398 domain-containing protein n=1 Tax=Mycolicibacterium phocaicum TaxID=319706 RepID=A0A7I7ZR24_9MYCO|nr:DUF6398 domain-containing protein [Mycolicibacterium phocaicum]TLH72365.1 hypothetical protein C1S79_06025 [Mycolicibacterium phocaicum]BBZ55221.1 hypothetical protein MPHO_22130 [Mycolicibacterium phocaicum]